MPDELTDSIHVIRKWNDKDCASTPEKSTLRQQESSITLLCPSRKDQ